MRICSADSSPGSIVGVEQLFTSLITGILKHKDAIEKENEFKKRDSVFLTPVAAPIWAAQADEEEAKQKAKATSSGCCSV